MGRIVLVSNRVADPGKPAQAGGVAVALASVLQANGGVWCGWDGHILERREDKVAEEHVVQRRRRGAMVLTTPLTAQEHDGFYLGYANSVLWPVFHNRLDLAQFECDHYRLYSSVNERFARLVAPHIQPDDDIWIHDYQFIPLGLELRKLGLRNPIGFFLHIPFPPAQLFRAIPEHLELARALAAYDLVGLQTSVDVANLLDYFQQGARGRLVPSGQVRAFDRIVSVESFPIGIDPAPFEAAGTSTVLVQGKPGVKRMIGIDRLDYSKGLPHKLRAFGRFLDIAPQYRREVVLTQIAPPTREDVGAYADIRRQLEALSGSINGRFGELDWVPIHYIHRSVARSRLPEIYRGSHVGLVTPLRDGMNLVAKEFVASQAPTDPGVLVLSQFAGAAEELEAALTVNPYDIEQTARAMLEALGMSLDERRDRHARLLHTIRSNDVNAWCERFMAALQWHVRLRRQPITAKLSNRLTAAMTALEKRVV